VKRRRSSLMDRFGPRLAATYVAIIACAAAAVGLVLYFGIREVYVDLLTETLARSARVAAAEATAEADPVALSRLAVEVAALTGARVTLVARDGAVLADTAAAPALMENHASRPEVRTALAGGTGVSTRRSLTTGERFLYVAVPAGSGLVVRLALPLGAVAAAVDRLRVVALAPLVLAALGGCLAALRSAARLTGPLTDISKAAGAMAGGDLAARAPAEGPAEVVELATALNHLGFRLQSHMAEVGAAKERLESLLAGLPVGVVVLGRAYEVASANPAAERLLAFKMDEVKGKHYSAVLATYALTEAIGQAIEHGERRSLEVETAHGADGLLHVSVSPRREADGRTSGAILVLEDLGQTRRDARLRRELVANVSHELKTPVAAIRALAETLAGGAATDAAAAERFLGHILRESERLTHLVDDLLELARLEAREQKLVLSPVDLDLPVARAVDRFRLQAEQKGVALDYERVIGLVVLGDDRYLERAVANFLDNALKFTPRGGRVGVSVAPGAQKPPHEAVVAVSDTGPGLPPEVAGRVFERFYRSGADRSRQSGGTGLGLAIVKHIAVAHGGRVGVDSTGQGLGCRFWFALPLVESLSVQRGPTDS
jgi:two-component system phosphate regulon sensor histidine kinase PhoR